MRDRQTERPTERQIDRKVAGAERHRQTDSNIMIQTQNNIRQRPTRERSRDQKSGGDAYTQVRPKHKSYNT